MLTVTSEGERRVETRALRYIIDAWEDALEDGVPSDNLANAALFAALSELIATYGETAVVEFSKGLGARIEHGEFTLVRTLQ
ncbi:MAG: hypothetical protein AAFQ42_01255 [Pseudomonadota bacterium]